MKVFASYLVVIVWLLVEPFIVSDPFAEIVTVPVVLLMMTYCSPLFGEAGRVNVIALVATKYNPA